MYSHLILSYKPQRTCNVLFYQKDSLYFLCKTNLALFASGFISFDNPEAETKIKEKHIKKLIT